MCKTAGEIISSQKKYLMTGGFSNINRRERRLKELLVSVNDHESEIADALKKDLGKSDMEALMTEIAPVKEEIRFMLSKLKSFQKPKKVKTPFTHFPASSYVLREPYGSILIISPWNYPFQLTMMPLVGAIAAGNCAVIKPSRKSPNTSSIIARIIEDVFDEKEVFVADEDLSHDELMAGHPDMIFFTGSAKTGRHVMEMASKDLIPVVLELGGKSPQIVFPDVEITDKLMNTIAANAGLFRAGQVCVAGTRIFVHKDIEEKFLAAFCERLKTIKVGNPLDESTECGAIVDRQQFETVCGYIEEGIKEAGRQPIVGGLPVKPKLLEGYYIEPTLFEHADNKWKISQEEIFGPVIVEIPWETEEEVIAMANDTKYGLSSYVYTNNIDKAIKTANAIEAGAVQINGGAGALLSSPYGGYKESGIGREYDLESMVESFSQVKNVHVNLAH